MVPADTQRARGLRSLERNVLEGALALFITDPLRALARARKSARGVSRNFFFFFPLFSPPNPINAASRRARKAKRSKTPQQLTHRPLQRPVYLPRCESPSRCEAGETRKWIRPKREKIRRTCNSPRRARYSILAFTACDCTLLLQAKSPGGGEVWARKYLRAKWRKRERKRSALAQGEDFTQCKWREKYISSCNYKALKYNDIKVFIKFQNYAFLLLLAIIIC